MSGDRLQLSRQGAGKPSLPSGPPKGHILADRLVSWYQSATGVVFPTPVTASPLPSTRAEREAPSPAAEGPLVYRQPKAQAAGLVDYYHRAAQAQVGYARPKTGPLPAIQPPRFAPGDYPETLMGEFPNHGRMLDAFAPVAFQRVYQRSPRPEEEKLFRRWLAPAFGTTSLSDPVWRYRNHAVAPGDPAEVIQKVETYRRSIFEAIVDLFEAHPEYGAPVERAAEAPPGETPELPASRAGTGGLRMLDGLGKETDRL